MLTIPAKEAGRRSSLLSCPIPIAQLSSRPPDVALSLCPHSKWSRRHPISSSFCLSTQTQKHSLETYQPQWPGNQIGYGISTLFLLPSNANPPVLFLSLQQTTCCGPFFLFFPFPGVYINSGGIPRLTTLCTLLPYPLLDHLHSLVSDTNTSKYCLPRTPSGYTGQDLRRFHTRHPQNHILLRIVKGNRNQRIGYCNNPTKARPYISA